MAPLYTLLDLHKEAILSAQLRLATERALALDAPTAARAEQAELLLSALMDALATEDEAELKSTLRYLAKARAAAGAGACVGWALLLLPAARAALPEMPAPDLWARYEALVHGGAAQLAEALAELQSSEELRREDQRGRQKYGLDTSRFMLFRG